ncbi:MAG TPA: hypothetical protein V6D28_18340 [Leptolyngbyaceae cyanobacterium]
MTSAYIPQEGENGEGSAYPSIFGLQLSPPVIGALVAVAGLGGAIYFFVQFVQPVLAKNGELKTQIQQKQDELSQLGAIEQKIAKAQEDQIKARRELAGVTALFANPDSLNTLLLDLNKRIEARNSNLPEDRIKAKLTKFEPDLASSGIVNDNSLGAQVNNKVFRQVFNVQMEGSFDQTRLFLIDLERQKSLAVVKELKSGIAEQNQRIPIERRDGQIFPIGNPETKITTSFKLQVLRPLTPEEQKLVAPTPTPGASGSASPSPAK